MRLASLFAAGVIGLCASCLELELPRGVSCGDGWWDVDYEACDASAADGGLPAGVGCPAGTAGFVTCASDCTIDYGGCELTASRCGNGVLEPGEECDPGIRCIEDADCPAARPVCATELGECMVATPLGEPALACQYYEVTAWNHGKDQPSYRRGEVGSCTLDCVFDREACNFCGDGQLDSAYGDLGWPDIEYDQPAEICDGEADPIALSQYCFDRCGLTPSTEILLGCSYPGCDDDCQGIEPTIDTPGSDPGCCVVGGAPCIEGEGALGLPCCYWLDNEDVAGMCVDVVNGSVCPSDEAIPGFGG